MEEEIHLENREDLNVLLKQTPYKYILLKFTADWCKPCKVIQPFLSDCVNEKIKDCLCLFVLLLLLFEI